MILQTERLLLRHSLQSDAVLLADLWADPDVTRYMGGPRDRDKIRGVMEQKALAVEHPQFDLWPLVERHSGLVAGHCGLIEKEVDGKDEIELCYILAVEFWGKGYATEIASALLAYGSRQLRQRRLIALIDPANRASEVVAQKIGMHHERDTIRPSGKRMCVYVWERASDQIIIP